MRNVSTHVSGSSVATELYAKLTTTRHTVSVLRVSKEILLLVALMLSADMMRIVEQMRNVMPASRNASRFVKEIHVAPLMPFVRLKTTESAATVPLPSLVMAMFTAD